MRTLYANILKRIFCDWISRIRTERDLTQAEMATLFCMDTRSYVSLERGESCCSALTLALFLMECCEDPMKFFADLKAAFETADSAA